ncbi:PfkB family carbohydrate kinase [Streptomyces sp. Marseille-Q5077]|uniref:PfkB family carbohydrate kinase n=1 Tax=Streptomyces sp. Marseille-Q5077 TaxID=3418995 RepID=UPI003D00E822
MHVDVVAAVGAGDAFAAGFLSGTLRGLGIRERLRHGHLMAAAALTVSGDLAAPPSRGHADRLVALDDLEWEKLRLGPGWTQATERAAEEVRTP